MKILLFLYSALLFSCAPQPETSNLFAERGDDSALVIVDMQPKFATRFGYHEEGENPEKINLLLKRQLEAIELAKDNKVPVILIEYENYGDTNDKILAAVKGYPRTAKFLKNTDDLFSDKNRNRKDLLTYLEKNSIDNLIILGANGGACVRRTITSALEQDKFHVIAYKEGIADFNFREFKYPYSYTSKNEFVRARNEKSFVEADCLEDLGPNMICKIQNYIAAEALTSP